MRKKLAVRGVQRSLRQWFVQHGRDLPWRRTRDPYRIVVSEVMLQQTQVDRVIPKYEAWLRAFPTWSSLARASLRRVLKLWSGLGYNTRAVRLRELARIVLRRHKGNLPRDINVLDELPGIGRYTARAIMAFVFHEPVGAIDTNVRRVVTRLRFGLGRPSSEGEIQKAVDALVPQNNAWQWHHAVMDLGALVCTRRRPKCELCPLQNHCRAFPAIVKERETRTIRPPVRFEGSDRFWRGRITRTLLEQPSTSMEDLRHSLQVHGRLPVKRFQRLLLGLERHGLLERSQSRVRIRP